MRFIVVRFGITTQTQQFVTRRHHGLIKHVPPDTCKVNKFPYHPTVVGIWKILLCGRGVTS